MLFAALAIYSGCSKDEEDRNGTPVVFDSATFTGKVQAQLDLRNDTSGVTNLESVPGGIIIYAKYNSEDLVSNPSGATYSDAYLQTTVSASGTYKLRIPVNTKNVSISIYSDDFSSLYKADSVATNDKKDVVFTLPAVTVEAKPHQSQIVNLTFIKK